MTRVRFAPSPTGGLHIGGIRTLLFNYLFAKNTHGKLILRIEDTDQSRYVPNAEKYIYDSIKWLNLALDEGPESGGNYGPYRQSERKQIYQEYIQILIQGDLAYYAFDSVESLEDLRNRNPNFKYDASVRNKLNNSLTISKEETDRLLANHVPYTVRLKVEPDEVVAFHDLIRGDVQFNSSELDDKVLMKADGLPTYHFANVVDDYLMKITHVIRGEEWLSSTAHHVLLYKAFGWEKERPVFSHLPLILKPTGKGKLSKRDGAKFDMPVFPIEWNEEGSLNSSKGFKEFGFLPEAVLNFLALLGWNPGNDKELMTIQELIEIFTLDKVSKSGARFDFEKAKWFNQQYLLRLSEEELYPYVKRIFLDNGNSIEEDRLYKLINLFKDRVITLHDFYNQSLFLFQPLSQYDETAWRKKVDESLVSHLHLIGKMMDSIQDYSKKTLEETLKSYLIENNLSPGKIFPLLRIAVSGFLQGPDLMATLEFLGPKESTKRIERALELL